MPYIRLRRALSLYVEYSITSTLCFTFELISCDLAFFTRTLNLF